MSFLNTQLTKNYVIMIITNLQKIIKHDIFKYVISIKYVITIVFMTS